MKEYFILVKGERVPVTKEVYDAYYQHKEHEDYIVKRDQKQGLSYYNDLDIDGANFDDVLCDYLLPSVEDITIKRDMIDRLRVCLSSLTYDELKIINALYFQNLTVREAAKTLKMPVMTLYNRNKRLLLKLKKLLDR